MSELWHFTRFSEGKRRWTVCREIGLRNEGFTAFAYLHGRCAKEMLKRLMIVLSAGVALLLGSCGSTAPTAHKGYVIGFSDGFCANTWRTEMTAGLKMAAAKYEKEGVISKLIILCANGSISTQIEDINTLIADHVNALLLIPQSGSALVPVVTKATEEHIVTVPFNLPLNGGKWDAYVGTDACYKGKTWAEWLVKEYQSLHLSGPIIGLGGIPGNSFTAAAYGCAKPVLDAAGLKVAAFRWDNWQPDTAKAVMASLITAYPNIAAIWSDSGFGCYGAWEALLAAGKPLIPCTADDYNGSIKLWLQYHNKYPDMQLAVIAEPPAEESVDALNVAINILEGKHVPKMNIIKPPLVTGNQLESIAEPNLPDAVFDYAYPLTKADLEKLFGGS